jgi:lipopolysaccharide export system permease protein
MKLLHRYIFREIASPFLLGLLVFTLVLLMGKLLKLADLVIGNGVSILDILLLLVYLMPSFCLVTIPMAFLLAVLLAFGRLSSDSEITAMKSSGVGLSDLFPPVLVSAALACAATAFMTMTALPWGQTAFKKEMQKIVESRMRLDLKEGVFNDQFPGIVLYVDKFDSDQGSMSGIIVHDERDGEDPSTVFASSGAITRDTGNRSVRLHLSRGSIHREMPTRGYRLVTFEDYDVVLGFGKPPENALLDERTMTLAELNLNLRHPLSPKLRFDLLLEYHRRVALPWACFIFALVGMPLGMQNRRSGRSSGFSVSIGIFVLYYILLSVGSGMAEKGIISPMIGAWLPNLTLLLPGIYLARKAMLDEEIPLLKRLTGIMHLRFTRGRISR